MRRAFRMVWGPVAVLSCWTSAPVGAAQTTARTNLAALSYAQSIDWEPNERSEFLAERFLQEVTTSESIVFDRFTGPASRLAWTRRQNALGYDSIARFNSDGAKLFTTIGLDSLRTAALEALPLGRWEDYWRGSFTDLIIGTLGNPEEEHIEITATSYSAVRSSWERGNERAGIQWGFRPWRTSPYLYFLAHAGRMAGRSLITFEGRGGYTMFGATRLEARLTFQLPGSFRLAASGRVDPARFGSSDPNGSQFGITLERLLPSRAFGSDGIFYIGFRSAASNVSSNPQQENMVVAGLSTSW